VRAEGRVVGAPLVVDGVTHSITCVSMGNPHCVLFVDDTATAPVHTLGPRIETDPFFPKKVNVEFVQLLAAAPASRLRMRVWERGSGETQHGTGACGGGGGGAHGTRLAHGEIELSAAAADRVARVRRASR
jgi:diaminopimelate epimerase